MGGDRGHVAIHCKRNCWVCANGWYIAPEGSPYGGHGFLPFHINSTGNQTNGRQIQSHSNQGSRWVIVEAVVSGVANGIMYLLNGDTTASEIARHALTISMFEDPSKVSMDFGTVNRALAFLSGYGIYICLRIDLYAEC